MTNPKRRRKNVRSGEIVRVEPQGLNFLNANPKIRASFEQVGCIKFCKKIHGYNRQVAREFAENFNGTKTKVGNLQLQVSEDSVVAAIEILVCGDNGSKVCSYICLTIMIF
jgi:hypothetical protein